MHIASTTLNILNQLSELCSQLNSQEYARSLPLLMDNSIGKHIRHILEFYDRLMLGMVKKEVNYDYRDHNIELEGRIDLANEKLDELKSWILNIRGNCELEMFVCYDNESDKQIFLETNLNRELVYNIEHAIHHMAIIRIALINEFPKVKVDKDFGIAYSTVKYRDEKSR